MLVRILLCASSFALSCAGFVACGDSTFQSDSDDGGADATASDVVTADVVVADAASPDASSSDPCSVDAGYTVCDDFDSAHIRGIWSNDPMCVNPFLDSAIFVSPPNSLLAKNLFVDGGVRSCSYFSTPAAMAKSHVRCEVDVSVGTHPNALFTLIEMTTKFDAVTYHQLAISFDGTNPSSTQPFNLSESTVATDGGLTHDTIIPADPSTVDDGWFHVVFDVDYAGKAATATIADTSARLTLQAAPSSNTVDEADVRIGFTQLIDAGITTVRYDNVFCEAN